eukprot:TRINITY_DN3311_c0_g1_i5.p1 TRINITY_DN3311_c0_g1~~TRINITY_DN3311_c0_g1_i5.p1  ORF type:complete len:446 (+),score=104.55 TRINITY_DN3311_c0_g1_i5:42-1379(+)
MASSQVTLARLSFLMILLLTIGVTGFAMVVSWRYGTVGPTNARVLGAAATVLPWFACLIVSFTPLFRNPRVFQATQLVGGFSFGICSVILYWTGAHVYVVPLGVVACFLYMHMLSRILFHYAVLYSVGVFAACCGMMAFVYSDQWWLSLYYTGFFLVVLVASHFNLESRLRHQFALGIFVQRGQEELREEKQFTRSLIVSIVPEPVLMRLASSKYVVDKIDHATCLAFDIVGFTPLCATLSPQSVVVMLATLFSLIDAVVERHGCERLKTLGDAYIAVCNVTTRNEDHAEAAINTCLDVLAVLDHVNEVVQRYPAISWPDDLRVRAGCHTGPMLAGAIQMKCPVYDVWGPTPALAEAMQDSGDQYHVHCSGETMRSLRCSCDFAVTPAVTFQHGSEELDTFLISGGPSASRFGELCSIADRVLHNVNTRFEARQPASSGSGQAVL